MSAVLAPLQALTIGQKVAGALLGLLLWLAPAGAVWLYMHGKAGAQFELGQADARATCAETNSSALATAIKDAREQWNKTQSAIDAQASKDAAAISKHLAEANRAAGKISKELQAHATANPLPADCRLDGERVRLYNEARIGQPDS